MRCKGSGPTGPVWVFRAVLKAILWPVGGEVVTNKRREKERSLVHPSPCFQPFLENWLHFSSGSMSQSCIFTISILSPSLPCLG